MSRSGYSDDNDPWAHIRWRGQVASATRGKRGQRMFIELRDALDAMPNKRLITGDLEADGEVCTLGALGQARGIDMKDLDICDTEALGETFDVAHQLAAEVMWMNDDAWPYCFSDEDRWTRVRAWVDQQIRGDAAPEMQQNEKP